MAFVLKTIFNDETRRVLIDPVSGFKISDLKLLLAQQWPQLKSPICSYVDDENDQVTIKSDEELKEGFRLAKAAGWKSLKILLNKAAPSKRAAPPQPDTSSARAPVIHWGFVCDASGVEPIVGSRYHKIGTNYDLCEEEFAKLSAADQAAFEKIDTVRGRWWKRFNAKQEGGVRGWRRQRRPQTGGCGRGRGRGPCGSGGRGRGFGGKWKWKGGCGRNALFRKCKKMFWMLRGCDLTPLTSVLAEAGGVAAEACKPLEKLAAALRDDSTVVTLKRLRRSPVAQKLKEKLRSIHASLSAGDNTMWEVPMAILNSEEWALAVATLRDSVPALAQPIEKIAELAPGLQAELPMLLPRLFPALMAMAFMGRKAAEPAAKPAATKLYKAKFVKDNTVPDGTVLTPSEAFTKTWTVANCGDTAWPANTSLLHVGGDMELRASAPRIPVGAVQPKEQTQLSVELMAPSKAGRFWSYWRLVADDSSASRGKFSNLRLWADVTVADTDAAEPEASAECDGASKEEAPVETTEEGEGEKPDEPDEPMLGTALTKASEAMARRWFKQTKEQQTVPDEGEEPVSHCQEQEQPVKLPKLEAEEAAEAPQPDEGLSALPPPPSDATMVLDEALDGLEAPSAPAPAVEETNPMAPWQSAVEVLTAMGFGPEQFKTLVKRHKGNVGAIVQELLQ